MDITQYDVHRLEPDFAVRSLDIVITAGRGRAAEQTLTLYATTDDPRSAERLRRYAEAIANVNSDMDAVRESPGICEEPSSEARAA